MTHHHDREVVDRGTGVGTVAVVAIIVLVILAALALLAFGGLDWLRGGAAEEGRPGVAPTLPGVLPTLPPAEPSGGLFSPPVVLAASG
jgi:hypothetical protein